MNSVLASRALAALVLVSVSLSTAAAAEKIELTDRNVQLYGAVTPEIIPKIVQRVLELDAESHEPIWLLIDSFGGAVDSGFILIDTIRGLKSPVYCVVTSKAYSMGAIIAAFCKRRYILPHGTMMFHEASYGALGEDPSIRSRIDFNVKYLDRIHEELAKILQMPLKEYRARIRDAWWVLADEAVKAHMVDAVVSEITYRKVENEVTEIKTTVSSKRQRVTKAAEK